MNRMPSPRLCNCPWTHDGSSTMHQSKKRSVSCIPPLRLQTFHVSTFCRELLQFPNPFKDPAGSSGVSLSGGNL
jgi:hypothetical protein